MPSSQELKHSRQKTGVNEHINLRDLQSLKEEITAEAKELKPMLANEIKRGAWPMLKHSMRVRKLVVKKQKYLALLSSRYNLRATQVESQVLS
jgi:hypothetical protein